jgi:hypothetical protein
MSEAVQTQSPDKQVLSSQQLHELKAKADSVNFAEDFNKDMPREEKFLTGFGSDLTNVPTELELMLKVYNEQLESFIRVRFDSEIFAVLSSENPTNTAYVEDHVKTLKTLALRRKSLAVIRKQIIDVLNASK